MISNANPRKHLHTAAVCIVLLVATTGACSGSTENPSSKETTQTEKIELTSLDNETCEGIFDANTIKEAENEHGMRKVHLPRTDVAFFASAARHMSTEMVTSNPAMSGCDINDSKNEEALLIDVNWGPETFPTSADATDTGLSYSTVPESEDRFELLIDCQRPDLAGKTKGKRMLAARVSLLDHVGFSDRARVSLLNHSAKELTVSLDCRNEISYPEPGTVKLD